MVLTGWQAFELGGNDLVAVVTFASMLTFAVATPIGGLLADAVNRRQLVLISQATAGAATGALGLMSMNHLLQPAMLIVLTWIAGSARGIEIAAAQSFSPAPGAAGRSAQRRLLEWIDYLWGAFRRAHARRPIPGRHCLANADRPCLSRARGALCRGHLARLSCRPRGWTAWQRTAPGRPPGRPDRHRATVYAGVLGGTRVAARDHGALRTHYVVRRAAAPGRRADAAR